MTIPYITPKQQEIPKLIYRFRFLDRLQIQKLLNHKDKRRINSWLKDLCPKDYLEKVPKNNTFEERTKLTIYRIGINGIRFLKTQDNCSDKVINKLYKDNQRSVNFIKHCILLCDIYLDLARKKTDTDSIRYKAFTASDFIDTHSPFHFLTELNPHLVYEEKTKYTKITKRKYFLVEAFENTLPSYAIKKRIRSYIEFYFSFAWEDNADLSFPTLKFICPSKTVLINAKRYTKKLLEDNQQPENLHIKFATAENVNQYGVTGAIWE